MGGGEQKERKRSTHTHTHFPLRCMSEDLIKLTIWKGQIKGKWLFEKNSSGNDVGPF